MTHELAEDVRIAVDVVAASVVLDILKVIARKAFIEPAAARVGQAGLMGLVRALREWVSKSQGNQDASR